MEDSIENLRGGGRGGIIEKLKWRDQLKIWGGRGLIENLKGGGVGAIKNLKGVMVFIVL